MSEDDISHLNGLDYARDDDQARERVESASGRGGVLHARDAGRAGPRRRGDGREHAPEKSTYFFPKVLTGMVFNPLDD